MTTPETSTHATGAATVRIATDIALIALFDPALLKEHVKEPRRWWEKNPFGTPERADGRLALWPLGGRGGLFRVRLGAALEESEAPYDRGTSPPAPLVVSAEGQVFLGPAERLPGDGYGDRYSAIPDKGGLLELAPGTYSITAHALDWRPEARFWDEENEPTPDAPPDFVLVYELVDALPPAPPAPITPLLQLLPQKKARGGERVVTPMVRPRAPIVLEDEKPKRGRAAAGGGQPAAKREPARPRAEPLRIAPGKPGELREGARVRHATYGMGSVVFFREGFPKARVAFDASGEEVKVDKSELTILS